MANILAKIVESIQSEGIMNIVIDITTFTHESLLILLKILYSNKSGFEQILCAYTGAQSYGGEATPPDQKWLSKGCKDVRNVLGYPGILRPSVKTCLIILAGFELERATRLIELIEPDRIAIGNGIEPTNGIHEDTMLIAFSNHKIQLCYSIPEIYNIENYSTPGEKVTVFDLNGIELFSQ